MVQQTVLPPYASWGATCWCSHEYKDHRVVRMWHVCDICGCIHYHPPEVGDPTGEKARYRVLLGDLMDD